MGIMDNMIFTPRQVTDPNDILDEKSVLFIRSLLLDTQAVAHRIEGHNNSPNTDGFIELIDEDKRPIGKLIVQAKTYKSKYEGKNKAEIPAYFVAYADRMRNEVCLFFSVDADANRIYWKYISDEYIKDFKEQGDNASHIYHFSDDEVVSRENVNDVIERWKQIFDDKVFLLSKRKKSAEEIISENIAAFRLININFHHLKNSFVERKEIDLLFKWIKGDLDEEEPNVKLLVGNAGMGKSVVIKQVIQKLEEDGIKCFALKADRFQMPSSMSYNEHLEALINTFSSLTQEEKAVLVIDQIDALSQYITNDRTKLENVVALIEHFATADCLKNVRIIVSCRSFDLEFDPKLRLLGHNPRIELGVLNKSEVVTILNRLKDGLYNELDEKTIAILQTPQHLNLFCQVYVNNQKTNYFSITDLYDELWRQTINLSESSINKETAEKVLYGLAQKIYDDETLTPQWESDTESFKESSYLISKGIIEQVGNKATFFHQSMYDYVFARYHTKGKQSFIQKIVAEKKHQGLFLRSTVNMVLDYERAKNIKQYKEDVKTILFSKKVRVHIQQMFLWGMANRTNLLPFEKKCIKELFLQNPLLFYSFIKQTKGREWYDVISPLIVKDIKEMVLGDIVYMNIHSYLWNHVQVRPEDVFKLIDGIKDDNTRNTVAQRLLYVTPDFSSSVVTKWYKLSCLTYNEKAEFLKAALQSNPIFVLENISDLIAALLNPKIDENSVFEKLIEDICESLIEKYDNDFYFILRDKILEAINANRITTLKEIVASDSVFPPLMRHDHSKYAPYKWFNELLKKRVKSTPDSAREDIKLLLNQKEKSCYEFAFSAIGEDPILFSKEIIAILQNSKLIDEILYFSDVTYYFLKMLRKWLSVVDSDLLAMTQKLIYDFKSESDSFLEKERKNTSLHYPLWGYNQRKLIWAIPEHLRNQQNKIRLLELNRRFGNEWDNTKPDHDATAVFVCGGLMSIKQYKTVTFNGWLNSFYGVQCHAQGKSRHFDERVHADAFKQCVSEQPDRFDEFVFSLFDDDKVPILYKLSGLDGLASAHYPIDKLLPYLLKSLKRIGNLFKDGYSYRIFDVIDNVAIIDGEYISKIIDYLEKIILSEYKSKYKSSIEDEFNNNSGINDMLTTGINTYQGYAIHSLAKIGKMPQRKAKVYGFFMKVAENLSLEHQLAAMHYLQMECCDDILYNEIMFRYSTKPISDYLFLNANRMHWFWYNDPEKILPYFRMIVDKNRAKTIMVQLMFFGLQYEKSRNASKEMFEFLLSQNEEEVIKKVIPLAYQHLSDDTYREQSELFLKRYANDSREEVRESFLLWCNKMPTNQIYLFRDLLGQWVETPIKVMFRVVVEYLEKTCCYYPYECYQCIKMLIDGKKQITYYDEENLFKILLSCYRIFMDDEEIEKADEVMDIIDTMMLESYTPNISKIIEAIDNN